MARSRPTARPRPTLKRTSKSPVAWSNTPTSAASPWKARSACWAALKTATEPAARGLEHITDPDQAVEFAERTGVDALAIAIGTSHGAYKFNKKPDGSVLKMDVLIEIHKRLPRTHLVMHGSSSVPKDLQDIVNQYGGQLKETWGVPVEEIQLGIKQRRAQDQRGHRQSPGHHRRHPQGLPRRRRSSIRATT
jgi:hypothetical protein